MIITFWEDGLSITIQNSPPPNFARTKGYSSPSVQSREVFVLNIDTEDTAASNKVSLSASNESAAKNDISARLKLPNQSSWMNKEFSDDILAEAKNRLAERQAASGIGDGYLPNGIYNLPLLPENQALLDQFRQEMKEIGHSNSDPEKSARFNQLLNLSMRVQIEGWKTPMSEADVQRELDIQQAMAVVDSGNASQSAQNRTDVLADPLAGWKLRWQQEKLTMPSVDSVGPKSLWLDLADKAGISQDEFMEEVRELATRFKGNALTQAVEEFISDCYLATKASAPKK